MINLETRRKRIETLAKIGALVVTCLVLGPFYLVIMHGLGALFALIVAFEELGLWRSIGDDMPSRGDNQVYYRFGIGFTW